MNKIYKIFKNLEFMIAKVMFFLTIIFISLIAIIIQYMQLDHGFEQHPFFQALIDILLILWVFFFLERVLVLICCKERRNKYVAHFFIALLPPLRLAARRCDDKEYIWWIYHWQLVDQSLYQSIEKRFLYPILAISLLMIPFWIAEIIFKTGIETHPFLYHIINWGNALIWGLFTSEFIILFSMAKKQGEYLIKHWLELFIIILPLLALSRFLLISKYLSISKSTYFLWFVKIQEILNIYRARSVINRIIRILILINIVRRFYQRRNPEKYLIVLQEELAEKELEIADLKKQISEMEDLIIRQKE